MAAVTRKMTLDFGVPTKTIATGRASSSQGTSQIVGEVTVNQDGNSTWSVGGKPIYVSNKENNYEWRPASPSALNDLLPIVKARSGNQDLTTNDINKAFYNNNNNSTVTTLNNARRNIMTSQNSGNGFNSPEFAKTLPGGPNYQRPNNPGGEDSSTPTQGSTSTETSSSTGSEPLNISNINNLNIVGEAAKVDTGLYKYPLNKLDGMDYIEFKSITYGNRGISDFNWKTRDIKATGETVLLPIQPSITDNNSVRWNESQSNPVQIAGANISLGAITGGSTGLESKLNEVLSSVSKNTEEIKNFVALYMAGEAVKTNLLTKMTGSIVNPNLELLFEAPTLRPFTFNFKMSPRDPDEAENVQKIIRFFKKNMAPQTTTSGLFLKTPNVFQIRYVYGEDSNKTHPGLNLIKSPCALQSCNVDYTPDGSYMTFNESGKEKKLGAMVSYSLTLQFMELEPVYAKDYDEGDAANHNIGY